MAPTSATSPRSTHTDDQSLASPGKAIVVEKRRHFTPHVSFFGGSDDWLGISMFWTDKFIATILYLQRYAIILMWNVSWPQLYSRYSTFYYGFLLDFTAHPTGRDPLGQGTVLEGCETGCKVLWPMVCIPILFAWAAVSAFSGSPLYYTRNIERILWSAVRLMLLPFCSMLIRYYILNLSGDLGNVTATWNTPLSELGVVFLTCTVSLFVYLGIKRSHHQILFHSSVRHESYLKTRELEYRLRLSATYRNDRIWMISSYVYEAWFWSVARGIVDVFMLLIVNFVPPKTGVVIGDLVLFAYFAYGFFFDIYRCPSTNHMEHVYNCTLFVYSVLATIQAYKITSTWLVDTDLDYFLLAVGAFTMLVTLVMALWYFIDSHRFVGLTVAERRANEKWRRLYGDSGGDKYVQLEEVELRTMKEDELSSAGFSVSSSFSPNRAGGAAGSDRLSNTAHSMSEASFHRGGRRNKENLLMLDDVEETTSMKYHPSDAGSTFRQRKTKKEVTVAVRKSNEGNDSFYLPRSGGFLSIDSCSKHLWPVHDGYINELLRLNQENHLVDMLRAGRTMLDRISALHNTAILIPLDELKTHIFRLQQCVDYCRKYRIVHHCNLIHPLQAVFEELIEQFTYELRIFSGVSITVGHNAKKMIKVSRELHVKQVQRDMALALVSPLMRRILVKLLALRLFIQLLEKGERRMLLGLGDHDSDEGDGFGPRNQRHLPGEEDGDSSSSDDEREAGRRLIEESLKAQRQAQKTAVFHTPLDDPFADAEELDPFGDPDEEANADRLAAQAAGGTDVNLYDDLPGVDEEDQMHESEMAAMLAAEARKLIKKQSTV
ncbi:transmembrane protein, putative [Bodo saltans]|uniref:Transmembrane protein, putative n=1 Tax=Bodo saltans TaxID=75058 RepID=A0A0S4INF1_BODSA|nr:transmembrane protein, putative [Bodo saltans]|eukprot:CUE64865.1 transmembrane protein, putative [Bodo saltans]